MKRSTVIVVVCSFFILLFTYAATMKLSTLAQFKAQLGLSPPVEAYAGFLAIAVPAAELLLVVSLLFPQTRLVGLYGCYSFMVMFTTYIIIILKFSQYVPCSCGGVLQNMSWGEHLVFNIVAMAVGAIGVLAYPQTGRRHYVLGSWVLEP